MKKGIEMEEINPRLPLSVNGIPDAKNTLQIMENAPVVIVVFNTNGKSSFVQLDVDGRFSEMNDLLSIGAIALGYKAETPAMRPRKKIEDISVYFD